MISFRSVSAHARKDRRVVLRDVTFDLAEGIFAILGGSADGTTLLLDLALGAARVDRGEVQVCGLPPSQASAKVAVVPKVPILPRGLRVAEALDLEGRLRGAPARSATERLAVLGIESLARRSTDSLSLHEARAVALAMALTSAVRLLLVDEPLVGLDAPASLRAVGALRTASAAGTTVLVTTSSVRDATMLADRLAVLRAHTLVPLSPGYAHAGFGGARLRVLVGSPDDAGRLSSALRVDDRVSEIELAAYASPESESPSSARMGLLISGPNLLELASAVGHAASSADIDVDLIESAVMPVDAVAKLLASVQPRWGPPPARGGAPANGEPALPLSQGPEEKP